MTLIVVIALNHYLVLNNINTSLSYLEGNTIDFGCNKKTDGKENKKVRIKKYQRRSSLSTSIIPPKRQGGRVQTEGLYHFWSFW